MNLPKLLGIGTGWMQVPNVRVQIAAQMQPPRRRPRKKRKIPTNPKYLCECGKLRHARSAMCDECRFLDFGVFNGRTSAMVITALRILGPMSRTEVANAAKLSVTTAGEILRSLMRRGRCERFEGLRDVIAQRKNSDFNRRYRRPRTLEEDVLLYKLTDQRRHDTPR